MAVIKNNELIDFDGIQKDIDKLDQRFVAYGKSSIDVITRINNARKEEIETVRTLKEELRQIDPKKVRSGNIASSTIKDVEALIASIEKYKAALDSMDDMSRLNEKSIAQLKAGVSALKKEYDNLDPESADFADDQKRIADQTKQATAAINMQSGVMKVALKTVNEANNSYNKLSRETAELKKELKNLPGAFNTMTGAINKNNAQALIWQKTIERNDAALKKMDASMGIHTRNVGNYTSATNALASGLRDTAVGILGVATAYEAVAKSIQIIDQMTRLKLSLEAVSEGSRQVTNRWEMIASLADKTGQDVIKLTESYVNFTAASRNTALEGAKADAIFKSFAGSFSALGKSSEVAERGLYAVQQMMSKGKVSSEELNQQLAEALPGANKLFADALHVSSAELADMLKKGEVLAVDVLPKVAESLQRLYGDRAAKNLETISGSWTRVTNQAVKFLDLFNEKAGIAGFFSSLNNGLADTLKGVNRILEKKGPWAAFFSSRKEANANAMDQTVLDKLRDEDLPTRIARIRIEQDELTKSAKKLADLGKGNVGGFGDLFRSDKYKEQKADLQRRKALVAEMIKLNADLRRSERTDGNRPVDPPAKDDDKDKKAKRVLTQFEKLTKEAEKVRGVIVDELLADFKAGRELAPSDAVLEKWKKLYATISAVSYASGDQVPANLRELNDKLMKNPVDIASQIQYSDPEKADKPDNSAPDMGIDLTKYNALLGVHEKEMAMVQQKIIDGSQERFSDSFIPKLQEQLKAIQDLEKQAAIEQNADKKAAINEEIQLERQKYAEIQKLAAQDAAARRELQNAAFELAVESANAVFQISQDQLSADRESLQMALENELSLVQGNEAAQDRIKKEYARKDLELRQKQARLEKAQAAFSIGVSTARAVVNALATGGPPWIGIALAAIVGAMGAVQLAAVLAKPLPQFYKGTDNAPEGPAWVGERGPEIRESQGKMSLIEKPTIVPLKRGDKIYTAAETRAMLSDTNKKGRVNAIVARGVAARNSREEISTLQAAMIGRQSAQQIDYNQMTDSFVKALDSRPVHQTIMDEQGVRSREIRRGNMQTYNDKRFSLTK